MDADAGRDGLPQFVADDAATRSSRCSACRRRSPGIVENMGLGADIWFGARVMFCEGTMQPKLDLIGQALTRDLAGRYGPDVVVSFPDCSPRNHDQRRKDDELDARLGPADFNEIRRSRGLEPYRRSAVRSSRCCRVNSDSATGSATGVRRCLGHSQLRRRHSSPVHVAASADTGCHTSSDAPCTRPTRRSRRAHADRRCRQAARPQPSSPPSTRTAPATSSSRPGCGTPRSSCSIRSCCGRTTARVPPIGTCEWLDVQPRRIVAETRFAAGRAVRRGHVPALRAGRAARLVDRLRAAQGRADCRDAGRLAGAACRRVGPARILGRADPGEPAGADAGGRRRGWSATRPAATGSA